MNGSNGLNNGTNYTMSGGGEGLGSLSRDERRAKRKELKVELEKVKRDLQRVEMKISKKASKKQGSKYDDGKRGIKRKSSETGKTPASPEGMTREARKQVMLKERHRRVQSLWGQCGTILKQLKGNRNAWPFHKPVDWQTLNIPDYPNIVKNPIDMSTISEKLGGWDGKDHRNRDYKSPLEFRDDMRLIFDNCKLYNPVGSDVRIMGDGLADAFEKKWQNSNLEGKFANELEMQKIEEEDLKNFVSYRGKHQKQAAQVSSQIHHLESELNKMKQQLAGGGKRAKTSGGEDPNAEMTFEEKRKLSVNLGILPAEKLGRVVQIINEGPSKIDNSEEEIELDIDKLDNQTLWRLNKYVTSCLKGAKKASHQDKIQRMQQQQQETARKLEDVNATLASRSAGGPSTDFSPVSSKRNADEADKGSDSSDSESESAEGVGSDGDMKKNSSFAGDVTRVSTTRPQGTQPQILHDSGNRKVDLKNASAWETLKSTKDPKPAEKDADGASDGKAKDGAAGKGKVGADSSLWSEFQSREQQMKAREKAEQDRLEEVEKEKERRMREEEEKRKRQEQQRQARLAKETEVLRLAQADLLASDTRIQLDERTEEIRELQNTKSILPAWGLTLAEYDEDEVEAEEEEEGEL